ncbi:zinc-finger of the MIZ type in Nse subunit-domain-containing protein [Diplogelasinospora grovesii]|uniref:peptidylprolyl isomerase n=1 Tax=Diplogelasinospora grovesii TaxID=303347 RepID=A0AAN6NCE2_9PEZI|nr:zinc-finger of the MIZ type in Nse subunit-domain-containing protein [Diplogelasinospora grovesii]
MAPSRPVVGGARNRRSEQSSASASGGGGSGRARGAGRAGAELPPHEGPPRPLNEKAKRALAALDWDRKTRKLEQHLSKSAAHLRESVGAANDHVYECKQKLKKAAEKRRLRQGDDGPREQSAREKLYEEQTLKLEEQVVEMTMLTEAAMRAVIDTSAEMEDERAVLAMLQREVETAHQQRLRRQQQRGEDEQMEEDEESKPKDVREMLQTARRTKHDEYEALDAYRRYALHNDYIAFKKTWHDAQHPEDQVALPDPTTWFDEDGNPRVDGGGGDDDEDDDLVVEREIIDLKCPLSLQVMKEPYSSNKCRHTFEKSAILEYLRSNRGTAQCPVCGKPIQERDLFLDELMLRRVKRAEKTAATQSQFPDESSDEENEAGDGDGDTQMKDESVLVERTKSVKKERRRGG